MRKNESIELSGSAECDALLCGRDDLSFALFGDILRALAYGHVPILGATISDDVLVSLCFDTRPINSSLLCFVLAEKGSISLSDLDLPSTIGDGCECEGEDEDEGSLFLVIFSGRESTFTPLEAELTAFAGEGCGRSTLIGETRSFSRFLEIVRAIFVLATRSMSLLLARPMPCRRRLRRSLISPGSDIHMS